MNTAKVSKRTRRKLPNQKQNANGTSTTCSNDPTPGTESTAHAHEIHRYPNLKC